MNKILLEIQLLNAFLGSYLQSALNIPLEYFEIEISWELDSKHLHELVLITFSRKTSFPFRWDFWLVTHLVRCKHSLCLLLSGPVLALLLLRTGFECPPRQSQSFGRCKMQALFDSMTTHSSAPSHPCHFQKYTVRDTFLLKTVN